ncbi:MAG: LacI family DNA-binding transcriptional regulator [Propionicimonas sp.]
MGVSGQPAGAAMVEPGGPGATSTAPPARAATIYDVAEAAGVSHQTVSRLLKGEQNIGPKRRERIEQALRDLHYSPNEAARTLATNRARRIGALISDLRDWAPQQILSGAAVAARSAGYVLDIVVVDLADVESVRQAVAILRRGALAGVVVLAPSDPLLETLDLGGMDAPVVVEGEPDLSLPGGDLAGHPFGALVDHLAELGHRSFFHIAGPVAWRAARNRTVVYRDRLRAGGFADLGTVPGDWTADSGYAAMAAFDPAATAVVAANDLMALGAMSWLAEHGFRVPDDVSVVGFDGVPEGRFFVPPLTTVQVDLEGLGRQTVASLLSRVEGRDPGPPMRTPELVVRNSSAAPRRR